MSQLIPNELYYGNAETEMVRCIITEKSDSNQSAATVKNILEIQTLTYKSVFVANVNWKKHWSFLPGEGKIKCSMKVDGKQINWQIRLYPLRERHVSEQRWLVGRNGTFNYAMGGFSFLFPKDMVEVWDDSISYLSEC
jgi:hypothetical protein